MQLDQIMNMLSNFNLEDIEDRQILQLCRQMIRNCFLSLVKFSQKKCRSGKIFLCSLKIPEADTTKICGSASLLRSRS